MRKKIILYGCLLFLSATILHAQTVIVTDDSAYTIGQASAVLDVKSTAKGFLPPRVTASQKAAISSPAAGLMVYQTDGISGYYLWTGTVWDLLVSGLGGVHQVVKTASDTLTKTETSVLASNDITLTLPVITSADNGLTINIKNIGSYTDLIQINSNGTATIDGQGTHPLTRWQGKSFVAYDGNWAVRGKDNTEENVLDVDPHGSWANIPEALAFLAVHMSAPSVLRLGSGSFTISSTQTINLPYPVTFTGATFGATTLKAAAGLAGTPMFNCETETYFKMIQFDATSLSGYGTAANEDAIWLTGASVYYEIKDSYFDGFNKGIVIKNNGELWLFESDVVNAAGAGIEIAAGTGVNPIVKMSETDFTNCAKGISLASGVNGQLSVENCGFYPETGQVCIFYDPAAYTAIRYFYVTGNTWNDMGSFLQGFDFSRTDGRDADCHIVNNTGIEDHTPHSRISVINYSTATAIPVANTWYKAGWVNTSSITTKLTILDNRITYQPSNSRDALLIISGTLVSAVNNRNINIAIVKNGNTAVQYGETTLRITTQNQPFQFSTVIYLEHITKNDYFELFASSPTTGNITFQDIQWYTEVK